MHISLRTHDALSAPDFERKGGRWAPHIHWIVPTCDDIESTFVQSLLDKYATDLEAYSILPVFDNDTFCVELQFHDESVGERCRTEYIRAFLKGGVVVARKKQAREGLPTNARKRLFSHRMYRLPNGEMFFYYAKWDFHGNLVGKVYDEIEGNLRKKIIHRSVLEEAELVPRGKEPWVLG